MKITIFLFLMLFANASLAQELYVKTFGDPSNKAILFLHGGPGYNCSNFEATTAETLAEKGYYVIVYDRRGEGRSTDKNAPFDFKSSIKDINDILKECGVKKVSIIGHSFGGILATKYALKNAKKIESIFFTGSPVSLQASFDNIIARCEIIYNEKKDSVNLNYLKALKSMDSSSLNYSSYCLTHAMQNGFYSPKNLSKEAKEIYKKMRSDKKAIAMATKMTFEAPMGFWKNENYTTLDLSSDIQKIAKKVNFYGVYGQEDGLYCKAQINHLSGIITKENVLYLKDCSHNVFIDQQAKFIEFIDSKM